jgi:hypothetical protein
MTADGIVWLKMEGGRRRRFWFAMGKFGCWWGTTICRGKNGRRLLDGMETGICVMTEIVPGMKGNGGDNEQLGGDHHVQRNSKGKLYSPPPIFCKDMLIKMDAKMPMAYPDIYLA